MSFFDRIGKAFDALPDVGEARSGIGAAWSWASEDRDPNSWAQKPANAIKAGTSWLVDPIKDAAVDVGEAISTAYSYGIARPLSTATQVNVNDGFWDSKAWSQAWDRSDEISPGQALATDIGGVIASAPLVEDTRPGFMKEKDPFSPEHAKAREDWFRGTWSGKLASGSIDLLLNFAADPTAAAGAGAKALSKAGRVVKAADRAEVLAAGVRGGDPGMRPIGRQSRNAAELITRLQQAPLHEIPAMPEIRDNADAGAMAVLIQKAKELYPNSDVAQRSGLEREKVISVNRKPKLTEAGEEQRRAIADVLGTAWGDKASMDRLIAQRQELAAQVERISNAPLQARANAEFSFEDSGQGVIDLFDRQSQRTVQTQRNKIQDEIDRLDKVLMTAGQQPEKRVGSSLIEQAQQRRAVNSINESWVHTGLAGQPMRFISGAVGTRIPGHINIKDASAGYDEMVNVVALMNSTSAEMKQDLMTRWLKANTQNERMNVVDMTRRQIVLDAAKKYGLSEEKAREVIAKGDGRMEAVRNSLRTRLYSAADDEKYVTLADPDDDVLNVFQKPLLRSQLEDNHPVLDPREIDTAFKAATGSRMIDHLGSTDVAVGNAIGSMRDLAAEGLLMATSRWKDTALARIAYPFRIQTDSQLRQMVQMETMQFMASRFDGVGAGRKYLMTDIDNPESFSFKNFFKTGDYEEALKKMLSHDVGDSRFNLDEDDIAEVARTIASQNGGMADLGAEVNKRLLAKRRTGDWVITQPNDEEWVDKYIRVVNRQIKNSPTAMAALKNDNIDHLMALTRTDPAIRAEYREVGVNFDRIEEWLNGVVQTNNHYLPDPELRKTLLGSAHRNREEFARTGETLYHGTTKDFNTFMDPGPYTNRYGRQSDRQPTVYFTDNPDVAQRFTDSAWRYVSSDKSVSEDFWDLDPAEKAQELDKVLAALRKQASDHDLTIQRVSPDTGDWEKVSPADITGDDILDDNLRIGRKGIKPKVIKTKVYGKTLDLRKWENVPDDLKKSLFNDSETQWRQWGRSYQHEGDQKLLAAARAGGYGKIRVQDAAESGNESVVAVPEFIGHNRDVVREMTGDPNLDKSGTFVPEYVKAMFSGKQPKITPMPVHGEGYSLVEQGKIVSRYNKVRNGFYDLAADMPETVLARAPLFWDAYRKRISAALDNLDEEQIDSVGIDVIRKNAMRGARKDVGKVLFDATHSSNLSSSMRFLSPFFSAWEDTMSKWSMLMYDNPQIPVRAIKLTEAVNDTGAVRDSEGNRVDAQGRVFDAEGHRITDPEYRGRDEYVLLPKVFGKVFPGSGPVKVRKDSINSVFQGDPWWLPGFGPMVQVPANKIVLKAFPTEVDDPILKYILPYGTTTDDWKTQLLPKWAKAAQNSFGSTQDFANQEALFLAEATVDSRKTGKPVDLDKIHNKTRNFFILKAAMDNASPVSIVPDSKYQLYIDKAHEYASDKKRTDWQKDFDRDFPGFSEMRISLSANNTGIAATTDAYEGIQRFRKVIQKDPENGWFYLGPANHAAAFNGGVYDWEQTNEAGKGLNFRSRKDPQTALEDLQASQGWNTWNSFEIQVDQELERRGLYSTRQKGAEDLAYAKDAARKALADYNPAWDRAQAQATRGKSDTMIKNGAEFLKAYPSERTRADMVALQDWAQFRIQVKQALNARPNKSLAYNPDLQAALDYGAAQLKRNNYGFEAMYNRVLQYDDLSGVEIPDGT